MIGNNGEENTKPVANQKTQFISAPGSHERQLRERATELFSNSFDVHLIQKQSTRRYRLYIDYNLAPVIFKFKNSNSKALLTHIYIFTKEK